MVTTDPQAVAWSVALRSSGRVEVDVGRVRSVVYALTGVWMGLIAVAAMVYGGTGMRVFGAVFLAFSLALLVWSLRVALRVGSWRSPQVLVDSNGLTVRHDYLHVPWSDLLGATAYTANHNRWVSVGMSEQCYDAWLARRTWVLRVLARRPRRRRYGTLNLPPNLAVDSAEFAAWLTDEASQRRLAEIGRLRRDLDTRADGLSPGSSPP